MKFHFTRLLQNDGWLTDVAVTVDGAGLISEIESDSPSNECDDAVEGIALPGFQNAHSHSFQYAMAAAAENSGPGNTDDFWSWRETMYKLALSVNPDQLEAIATMLYTELLRHGYTNVAEFHYLHHNISGKPYVNIAEMGERLVSAAKSAGIGITLIPVLYERGGFGVPPEEKQRRFISSSIDDYWRLVEASTEACRSYEGASTGIGIHSMRAADTESIREVAVAPTTHMPIHIHISEQLKEVEECVSFLGLRPVQWMLENVDLSARYHFVHATHVDKNEVYGITNMNVNTALCPTTEGNLGDGLFPLSEYQDRGGRWSIGTDSHVSLNPFEEIRLLDYGQRLVRQRRNVFPSGEKRSSGEYAVEQAVTTGRKAMGNHEEEYFKVGSVFNAFVISSRHPLIAAASEENLMNTIIYSSDETMHEGTIVRGKWRSRNGRHEHEEAISAGFRDALRELNVR